MEAIGERESRQDQLIHRGDLKPRTDVVDCQHGARRLVENASDKVAMLNCKMTFNRERLATVLPLSMGTTSMVVLETQSKINNSKSQFVEKHEASYFIGLTKA